MEIFFLGGSKLETMQNEMADLFQLLSGLLVAGNYREGTGLLETEDFEENQVMSQTPKP